jgi:hypothetical protein
MQYTHPMVYPVGNVYSSTSKGSKALKKEQFRAQKKLQLSALPAIDYSLPLQKYLEQAAERELISREQIAMRMSERITHEHNAEITKKGWVLGKVAIDQLGFTEYLYSEKRAIQELTTIYHYFEPSIWEKRTMRLLFCPNSKAYNSRFYKLIDKLARAKMLEYNLYFGLHDLTGSRIDSFFYDKIDGLPEQLQQFVQLVIANYHQSIEGDMPQPDIFKFLLMAFDASKYNKEELNALFHSYALQKYEMETNNAFRTYIAEHKKDCVEKSWFSPRCNNQRK